MAADQLMWFVTGCAVAYAIGCFSTAYYLVLFLDGSDIRRLKSGTAGARNVGRVLGAKAGVAVATADIVKGAVAVWAGTQIAGNPPLSPLLAAAAITGHIWPVQLGWRGGKGLAAGFGALLWLFPVTTAAAAAVNLCLSLLSRSATLGTLAATAAVPIIAYLTSTDLLTALLLIVPCAIVMFAHRGNIRTAIGNRSGKPGPS